MRFSSVSGLKLDFSALFWDRNRFLGFLMLFSPAPFFFDCLFGSFSGFKVFFADPCRFSRAVHSTFPLSAKFWSVLVQCWFYFLGPFSGFS